LAFVCLLIAGLALAIDGFASRPRRTGAGVAGIMLALAGFLAIVATHWGHFR
jgi:hypothetical protein